MVSLVTQIVTRWQHTPFMMPKWTKPMQRLQEHVNDLTTNIYYGIILYKESGNSITIKKYEPLFNYSKM